MLVSRKARKNSPRQTRRASKVKPYKVGIMAIFKNEAMAMREWVEHYLWQGIDNILLINNRSTDNWKEKIEGLEQRVTTKYAPGKHRQKEYYNQFGLPWCKTNKIDILIVLDMDEFLFCKNKKTIKENLQEIFSKPQRPSEILVNWTMFGSSGLNKQPESIRKSFTMKKNGIVRYTKGIIWVNDLSENGIGIHSHSVKGKTIKLPSIFQLNHYAIQSKEFFRKVKMSRGSANVSKYDKVRNWDYFKRYDHKDREDLKLKNML